MRQHTLLDGLRVTAGRSQVSTQSRSWRNVSAVVERQGIDDELTVISRRMLGMMTLGIGLLMSLMATCSPVAFSLYRSVCPVPPWGTELVHERRAFIIRWTVSP